MNNSENDNMCNNSNYNNFLMSKKIIISDAKVDKHDALVFEMFVMLI